MFFIQGMTRLNHLNHVSVVSVIIPCRNEENFIGKCLDSIIANDYPKDKLEVLVIDGMSEDGTRAVLKQYTGLYPFIRVLDNHKKITPSALNVGVKNAKGEIIIRKDAHSTYEKDYISKCVRYLREYDADNVGGIWITVPRNDSLMAKAIVFSLSHPFGVGNAHYRIGRQTEPRLVDTVPFGCFRKDVFDRIGLFDEAYPRNEDIEFNTRLRKAGGKILLVPGIVVHYYARSTFRAFCIHNFDNGLKVIDLLKFDRRLVSWRHLTPLVFTFSLVASAVLSLFSTAFLLAFMALYGFYMFVNLWFSIEIMFREKNIRFLFLMPLTFSVLHLTYGLGSIWGIAKKVGRAGPRLHNL